jgi:type I restriction enzyme S subunit
MNLTIDKSDWKKIRLADVIDWYQKDIPNNEQVKHGIQFYATANHIDGDSVKFDRYSNLDDGQKGPTITKHFEKGDLLLSTRSVALRKAAIAPINGVTGEKLLVLRIKHNSELLNQLFPFVFQSIDFWEFAQNSASGSVNKFTSWTKIREYEFLLPPKDQQAQLAKLLWAMDEVIERENEVLERLRITSQVFFENEIIKSKGKKIPLAQVLIPKKSKSQVPHAIKKYIGLEHIKSGASRCTEYGNSSEVLAQCNVIEKDDLCYSKLRPYLDKAFIAEFEAVSTTELLIYDTKGVSKEYVLNHFHSRPFIQHVTGKGFGTKMPRVSDKIIGEFQIKVLDNENELLREMRDFHTNADNVASKISSSKALQKSLINQIF